MPQSATIKSLPAAFRMMKAMQVEGVEWGEDYRQGARRAVAALLRGRMDQQIDEHLERMAELGRADRRNGCYHRWLLTELRRYFFFDLDPDGGDPPDAAITLTIPSGISRGLFAVINDTGFDVTVEITGQALTPPTVADGEAALLTSDGINVRLAGGGAAAIAALGDIADVVLAGLAPGHMLRRDGSNQWAGEETPYDLSFFLPGTYSSGALMAQVVLDRAVTFPDGLFGAQGYAGVNATASTVLDVQKNGANIGTITFTSAGSTAAFAMSGALSFAPGDRLSIVNEDPADATLADVSLTLKGKRD